MARLLRDGHCVYALVRESSDTSRLRDLAGDLHIRPVLNDDAALRALIDDVKPGTIYHLAMARDSDGVDAVLNVNVLLGVRLTQAMAENGGGRIVLAGSWWQYDAQGKYAPNSLYAASKQALVDIVGYYSRAHGVEAAVLILYDIYGPRDWRNRLTALLCRAARGESIAMTPGEQKIELVHVDDAVEAFVIAGQAPDVASERPYFVGSGRQMSIRQVAATFERVSGRRLHLLWGEIPYPPQLVMQPCHPIDTLPGWSPRYCIEDGLKQVAEAESIERTDGHMKNDD